MRCSTWKFSAHIYHRDFVANISDYNDLYAEATLNNMVAVQNNSVSFTIPPVYIVASGYNTTLNRGAVDADGDSVVTKLLQPLGASSCTATPTPVAFTSQSPALNASTNSLQCANTFNLNAQTGAINFVPSIPGNNAKNYLTFKTEEYRAGTLIATHIHDAYVIIGSNINFPSPPLSVVTNSISGASWNNNTLQACIGTPVQFCFYFKSANPSSVLQVSDNLGLQFPRSFYNVFRCRGFHQGMYQLDTCRSRRW